jgi:hypothetical protein
MKNHYVKVGWDKLKDEICNNVSTLSLENTRSELISNGYYKKFFGKAKNRTMMKENPSLYKSIYAHTRLLEDTLRSQNSYKGNYNFTYRLLFITDRNCDIESLKCKCGKSYTWNTYCRQCPEYHNTWKGRTHSNETKKKQRARAISYIESLSGKVVPRYNKSSIRLIEEYGKKHGYKFQHAENGGEVHIKELGYFLDAYDKDKNVVLEIDEDRHFSLGELKESDVIRQSEIEQKLKCKFIRIRI